MRSILPPLLVFLFVWCGGAGDARAADWGAYLDRPAAWLESPAGRRVIRGVLARQNDDGGWPKNYDPADPIDGEGPSRWGASTIDNGATVGEMRLLARALEAGGDRRARAAFDAGLSYLLEAQYDRGGWPQFYPLRGGYHDAITYNDDAMVRVMGLLREVATDREAYGFVPTGRLPAVRAAYARGVRCVLETQVVVEGVRTAWCAQHDPRTLEPVGGRAYEHPSLSGSESVSIVRELMRIESPRPEVVAAVRGAVAWLERVKLTGVTYAYVADAGGARDRRLVASDDPGEAWWARFYEIGTNRPIFSGRDGVVRYRLSEVERERRLGYSWYSRRAASLLREAYPAWARRLGVGRDAVSP